MAGAQAALYSSGGVVTCSAIGVVCQAATACSNPITNPPVQNTDNACLYAQTNGFAVGSGGKNVTIEANTTNPPPGLHGVNDIYYVRARVAEVFPLTFSAVFGSLTQLISARSTAVVSGRQACVYVLDPSGAGALTVGGGVNAPSCAFFVNSNSPTAINCISGGTVTASQIGVVGNSSCPGLLPTPTTGLSPTANPLAYLQPPALGACTAQFPSYSGSSVSVLTPATFCGGINISGNASVIFSPGTYILNGGGLTISGNAIVTGSGVTFYDTQSLPTYPYGPININSAAVNLGAPVAGALQGILIFQDPAVPVGSATSLVQPGITLSNFNGVFYFPTTSLTFSNGTSGIVGYVGLVAYDLTFGAAALNDNFSSLTNGSPFKVVALVE